MRDYSSLYTKEQLLRILESWGIALPAPKRRQRIVITFPEVAWASYPYAEVFLARQRSTYDKALWRLTLTHTAPNGAGKPPISSPLGRARAAAALQPVGD